MDPIANTKQGKVRGSTEKGAVVFLGIPYAAAPVGEARFAPPHLPRPGREPATPSPMAPRRSNPTRSSR